MYVTIFQIGRLISIRLEGVSLMPFATVSRTENGAKLQHKGHFVSVGRPISTDTTWPYMLNATLQALVYPPTLIKLSFEPLLSLHRHLQAHFDHVIRLTEHLKSSRRSAPSIHPSYIAHSSHPHELDVAKLLASLTPEAWEAAKRQTQASVSTPPFVVVLKKRSAPPTQDDGPKKRRAGPSAGSGHAVATASLQVHGTGPIHASEEPTATATPHTRVGSEARMAAAAVKAKPRTV
jgi:hypothetical protein